MPKPISNVNPNNPPMTRGQRRVWLALEEQKRRRKRASESAAPVPAIVLSSDGHGRLTWTLNFPSGWGFNIYMSVDGVTWGHPSDGADSGARAKDESGVAGFFRICQCDGDGNDILPFSNVVYSDGQ